jgi:hypothetical protein
LGRERSKGVAAIGDGKMHCLGGGQGGEDGDVGLDGRGRTKVLMLWAEICANGSGQVSGMGDIATDANVPEG